MYLISTPKSTSPLSLSWLKQHRKRNPKGGPWEVRQYTLIGSGCLKSCWFCFHSHGFLMSSQTARKDTRFAAFTWSNSWGSSGNQWSDWREASGTRSFPKTEKGNPRLPVLAFCLRKHPRVSGWFGSRRENISKSFYLWPSTLFYPL